MKNPYVSMSNDELHDIAKAIIDAADTGNRCEKLVPYTKELYANINGSSELVTLRECLEMAQKDFYQALSARFINLTHEDAKTILKLSIKHLSDDTRQQLIQASDTEHFNTNIANNCTVLAHNESAIMVIPHAKTDLDSLPEDLRKCITLANMMSLDGLYFSYQTKPCQVFDILS